LLLIGEEAWTSSLQSLKTINVKNDFFLFSIGYPVVTLGFGFKSYVGYRMRQRRQREVQKDNEYYYQFLKEALPPGKKHFTVIVL